MKLTTFLGRAICLLCAYVIFQPQLWAACETNCEVQCIGQVNVSLDQTCMAEITPAMGGVGIIPECNNYYTIELYDEYGSLIPSNIVGIEYNHHLLTYKVIESECGNSCWGSMYIEYKYPPQIDCPDDLTVTCGSLQLYEYPDVTGGCADFDIELIDETQYNLDCDPEFTSVVTRTYRAYDEYGNESFCSYDIYVERVDISSIIFPPNASISCTDTILRFDEFGHPIPWISMPLSGSGTGDGVPIICDPSVTDGLWCPPSNDFSAVPLIPAGGAIIIKETGDPYNPAIEIIEVDGSQNPALCNAIVTYTDVEIPNVPCKRKIMRTWEVREWWCSAEFVGGNLQLIEIIDDAPPTFTCPQDYTVTTGYDCAANIKLAELNPMDACSEEINVMVHSAHGTAHGDGATIQLGVGENVLTYIVSDECYNQSTCEVTVTVRDNTPPVAACELYKVVSVSNSGYTTVYAEPFDNGSWDECGLEKLEVRRMDSLCVAADTLFGPDVSFCCMDVNDEVMVVLRATDWGGNTNECMVRVEVQDKIAPQITCPSDRTIDCYDGYDINNLSLTFGYPDVTDNCDHTQNVIEIPEADVNQCGVGYILRRFEIQEDSIAVAHCKQNITITNNVPFIGANIVWPLDYQVTDTCDIVDLDPEDLPEPYGFPTFYEDECNLLGYNYEDKYFDHTNGLGGCGFIERTWTVINWCGNSAGSFDQWTIPVPQRIEIINTTPPVMDSLGHVVVESQDINCLGDTVWIVRTATDDCNNLYWHYTVRDDQGYIIYQDESDTLHRAFPVGEYWVDWVVGDGCGNFDYDTQHITVVNTKAPTPVCINGLSVSLVAMDLDTNGTIDAEMVELWASDFDSGSSHSCGNPITFSLAQDTTVKNIVFDCDDIGIQYVNLYVTDVVTGYQDFCRSFVEVQDNNDVDFCDEPENRASVMGEIYTENLEKIEGVEVVMVEDLLMQMTTEDGAYNFANMPIGGQYIIEPKKDVDHLNGVSTLDLIQIQRHILGLEEISSPYKLIAADVDNNRQISAIDLIELRKLILGVDTRFTYNTSWRFVDASHDFLDPFNPWAFDIPETYIVNPLVSDMDIDFIGVKVGDVNNSALANTDAGRPVGVDDQVVELIIDEKRLEEQNGLIQVNVILANEEITMEGLQTALTFDAQAFRLVDVHSNLSNFNRDRDISYELLSQGIIPISYTQVYGERLERGDKILTFTYEALSQSYNKVDLRLNNDLLNTEAYKDNRIMNVTVKNDLQETSALVRVEPNPWTDNARILFEMAESGDAQIEIFNYAGQVIYDMHDHFEKGAHALPINRTEVDYKGVVIVKLTTARGSSKLKMMIL